VKAFEITFYGSSEEMMEAERRAQKEAARRTADWQKQIVKNDLFVSISPYGFPIFGEVLDDYRNESPEMQYYRFCDCYSIACPEGEKGDVHICTIDALITRNVFDAVRKKGWMPER
jgi:hypothetical protein